jgi:glycosyltransferase involved in cell wall biosynthesis
MTQPERSGPPSPPHRDDRKRIAWVTPDYPPNRGGVSDHSSEMVSCLRAAGHEVLVCSRPHERGFARLDPELLAHAPDLVVVAFTPLGYAPRTGGIALAFMRWCIGLRKRLHCQAILLAHEVNLPLAHHWQSREFKFAALAAAQIAQFSLLAASFDSVLFSNVGTRNAWARRLSRSAERFHTLRICSNIPFSSSIDPRAALLAAGYTVPASTILFFGTGHQTVLLDYVEEAFLALLRIEPNVDLVIVGMSHEKLRQLRPSLADLGVRVHALGYVSAEQVSLWLRVSTLVLAPLAEGVNARKGTVMAALQHGQAVVTTRGVQTRDDIAWDEICVVAPLVREEYATKVAEAFERPEWRSTLGRAARAEYDAHASAPVTAQQILGHAHRDPWVDRM